MSTELTPVSLIDVTLRDGGYMNGHTWTRDQAAAVVEACELANVDGSEVGYFRPRLHESDGSVRPTYCSPPEYLDGIRQRFPQVNMIVMVRPKEIEPGDYRLLAESDPYLVRFPITPLHLPDMDRHLDAARAAGLRITLNLIRVSEMAHDDIRRVAELAQRYEASAFYLADSNGSLFPGQVGELFSVAAGSTDTPLGFHAHDGLSLAFSNSLAALEAGCRYLDASIAGVGKGGGNLSLELMAGYLRTRQDAEFAMTPLTRAAPSVLQACDGDTATRFDSIASGLLDLNVEDIELAKGREKELTALVDARS